MGESWAFTLLILGILLLLNLYTDHRVKELLMALADDLRTIEDQLNKAKTEVTDKIEALEGALATSGEQTQEVTDAVAALKAVSQNLDDVVPDAVETVADPVADPVDEPVVADPVEEPVVEAVESVETPAEALVEALEAAAEDA
jgi:ABC-type transporter Mla subunit MlaD